MLYDLRKDLDAKRLLAKLDSDMKHGALVEYGRKTQRTPNQNRYLHLIIGVVAMETGNTLEYTKEVYFKRLVNAASFVREKEDPFLGKVQVLRSTRDLTVEETASTIDRFTRWAAENGIYIPAPEDEARLRDLEIEMGRMRSWL